MAQTRENRGMEPIDVLPECFQNADDVDKLDYLFDKAASYSHWTNEEVAWTICKVLHLICGD